MSRADKKSDINLYKIHKGRMRISSDRHLLPRLLSMYSIDVPIVKLHVMSLAKLPRVSILWEHPAHQYQITSSK